MCIPVNLYDDFIDSITNIGSSQLCLIILIKIVSEFSDLWIWRNIEWVMIYIISNFVHLDGHTVPAAILLILADHQVANRNNIRAV